MAAPTIILNNASGSDTAASGAGPATALSGTAASYSGSVFTLDGSPDLSGVATDGSHVIWVQTSTGRQFFTINAVDDGADTVTVDDAPAGTTTGLTWGLGGKRKTLDNTDTRSYFTDAKQNWILELEDDQTINSAVVIAASGVLYAPITVKGSDGSIIAITQTANAAIFDWSTTSTKYPYWFFENLQFKNSNATKTSAIGLHVRNSQTYTKCINCIFGDETDSLGYGILRNNQAPELVLYRCTVWFCTLDGLNNAGSSGNFCCHSCLIVDNDGWGMNVQCNAYMTDCIVARNGSGGVQGDYGNFERCVFDSNTGDGLNILVNNAVALAAATRAFRNNIFSNNSGYGLNGVSGSDIGGTLGSKNIWYGIQGGNAFYNNTSGDRNNVSAMEGDVTGTNPDYVDAANNDFTIQASGLKGTGDPSIIGADGTRVSYPDFGVIQTQASGGGVILPRNLNGGLSQ